MTCKSTGSKRKINKWDYAKMIKTSVQQKESSIKCKDNQQYGRRYLKIISGWSLTYCFLFIIFLLHNGIKQCTFSRNHTSNFGLFMSMISQCWEATASCHCQLHDDKVNHWYSIVDYDIRLWWVSNSDGLIEMKPYHKLRSTCRW